MPRETLQHRLSEAEETIVAQRREVERLRGRVQHLEAVVTVVRSALTSAVATGDGEIEFRANSSVPS